MPSSQYPAAWLVTCAQRKFIFKKALYKRQIFLEIFASLMSIPDPWT
jgi:hypothetical protein